MRRDLPPSLPLDYRDQRLHALLLPLFKCQVVPRMATFLDESRKYVSYAGWNEVSQPLLSLSPSLSFFLQFSFSLFVFYHLSRTIPPSRYLSLFTFLPLSSSMPLSSPPCLSLSSSLLLSLFPVPRSQADKHALSEALLPSSSEIRLTRNRFIYAISLPSAPCLTP